MQLKLHIKQESQPRTNFKDTHQKILSSCLAGILCVQQQDENGSLAVSWVAPLLSTSFPGSQEVNPWGKKSAS